MILDAARDLKSIRWATFSCCASGLSPLASSLAVAVSHGGMRTGPFGTRSEE
jgi:hypothetical protein